MGGKRGGMGVTRGGGVETAPPRSDCEHGGRQIGPSRADRQALCVPVSEGAAMRVALIEMVKSFY